MKIQELEEILKREGFNEDRLDSGCNYLKAVGHILFICYVEPGMEVEFITIYHWNNNDVKGSYNISVHELNYSKDTVDTFFRKTKENIPQFIGDKIDTHKEIEKAIQKAFK